MPVRVKLLRNGIRKRFVMRIVISQKNFFTVSLGYLPKAFHVGRASVRDPHADLRHNFILILSESLYVTHQTADRKDDFIPAAVKQLITEPIRHHGDFVRQL